MVQRVDLARLCVEILVLANLRHLGHEELQYRTMLSRLTPAMAVPSHTHNYTQRRTFPSGPSMEVI
jgi:hypothetical protein